MIHIDSLVGLQNYTQFNNNLIDYYISWTVCMLVYISSFALLCVALSVSAVFKCMWCIFPTYVWAHWLVGFIAIVPVERNTKKTNNKTNQKTKRIKCSTINKSVGSHLAIWLDQKTIISLVYEFYFWISILISTSLAESHTKKKQQINVLQCYTVLLFIAIRKCYIVCIFRDNPILPYHYFELFFSN